MVLNKDIFLGAGTTLTFIPECDLYLGVGRQDDDTAFPTNGSLTTDEVKASAGFLTNFSLIENLYIGCLVERYSGADDTLISTHRIKSNTSTTITTTHTFQPHQDDYFVIKAYGAPTPATTSTAKRLLSDQWLGILESATFPTSEVEMKQLNTSLGGSRNFTYQYKGITTFTGGNLGLVSNQGTWLYYFLGKCTQLICSTDALATALSTDAHRQTLAHASNDNDAFLIRSMDATTGEIAAGDDATILGIVETGPIFRRTVGNKICPPITPFEATDAQLDFYHKLDRPTGSTTLSKAITYTFAEQDGDLLPSFALEQNLSKLTGTATQYRTDSDAAAEDLNFVKIARGCRVNTLTMTANENEEVKMTLDLTTRNVHTLAQDEVYDARRGVDDETNFINYETSTNAAETREPFFFSDGTFKLLGNTFLKINSLTLTMTNNLQDRRFLGVGSKDVAESIPAQRTYEIQFTGHVSDDALYTALLNDSEDTTQTIELIFTKANGENITLKFDDYFISANNFPIPDDKGPLVVEATVMPRTLNTCTVKTHWVLQG